MRLAHLTSRRCEMLALGIRYLCGWAMASEQSDRAEAEWPPHPDRAFMALAAAHFEGDGDPDERTALEWLERSGAPAVAASGHHVRRSVTSYVPVNDTRAPRLGRDINRTSEAQIESGLALLPDRRSRQARQFPIAIPHDPTVFLVWSDADPPERVRLALRALCGKVSRIGHSASLVQMWLEDMPPEPTWIPSVDTGELRMRVSDDGRLRLLEQWFAAGLRPSPSLSAPYVRPTRVDHAPPATTVFSPDLIVLRRREGRLLDIRSAQHVAAILRAAVLSIAAEPLPEWLTGHAPNGRPSAKPHVAFLALPHVDAPHADGHLLGVALAIPRGVDADDLRASLRPVMRQVRSADGLRLFNAEHLDTAFGFDAQEPVPIGLQPETWTAANQPSRRWCTVTPLVLDRYPKREGDAERIVEIACERIGLPRPSAVTVSRNPMLRGVPPAGAFAPLRGGAGLNGARMHVHVTLEFEAPVVGPVLLGAGRFRGYGLCRPLRTGIA